MPSTCIHTETGNAEKDNRSQQRKVGWDLNVEKDNSCETQEESFQSKVSKRTDMFPTFLAITMTPNFI